jgi:hypothetical protein
MDALLFARYRRGGGKSGVAEWESSAGLSSWEDAPAPAHLGKRIAFAPAVGQDEVHREVLEHRTLEPSIA